MSLLRQFSCFACVLLMFGCGGSSSSSNKQGSNGSGTGGGDTGTGGSAKPSSGNGGSGGKSQSSGATGGNGTATASGGNGGSGGKTSNGAGGKQSSGSGGKQSSGGSTSTGGSDSGPTGTGGTTSSGPTSGGGSSCKGIAAGVTSTLADSAAVAVTVNTKSTGCNVAADFMGTNYESFADWGADVSMSTFQKQAFQAAGMQLFRYPGGEPGEWFDLLMTGKCSDGKDTNWGAPTYTALWSFAQSAGVHALMLQTNPTKQWCGSGDQDASGKHAAAIASDAMAHGVNTVFEIGNEPDISGSYFGMMSGGQAAYIDKFIEQANAIHQAVPTAQVYGPVVCGLGGNCGFPVTWDSGWLDAFLAKTGDKASGSGKGSVDGVSFHVYWHNEWNFSDLDEAKIDKYGFALYWSQTVMPYLRKLIAKYDSRDLPIAISEISIGNGKPNDSAQKQNMFTVLETLDVIGAFASSGLRSFQWFDANAEGPADYWMITKDQTRPIYYSFAAWSKMGDQVLELSSNANPHDVAVYATKKSDGSVQVLMINKTSSKHDVTLSFDGFDPSGKKLEVSTAAPAGGGNDGATSVSYNGASDPAPADLPKPASSTNSGSTVKQSVAAYSLAVINLAP